MTLEVLEGFHTAQLNEHVAVAMYMYMSISFMNRSNWYIVTSPKYRH
jgi:hypothetical protein